MIITAYNRKDYLLDAVKSALNQTLDKKYYEIIVIKNFSDNIIDDFINKNNIKNIPSNDASFSGKICEALKIARGNIISFLDDDDLFFNNKLEYVNKIFNDKNVVYYHNKNIVINENSDRIDYSYNNIDFNMSSISITREIIDINILKSVKYSIDTLMYMFALNSGKKIIDGNEILTYYRMHNSITHNFDGSINKYIKFNINSFNNVLDSYNKMYKLFNNNYIKNLLLHKIIFTYFLLKIFDNKKVSLRKYIMFFFTKSCNKNRLYEYKVLIASLFLRKIAIDRLYKNEINKLNKTN